MKFVQTNYVVKDEQLSTPLATDSVGDESHPVAMGVGVHSPLDVAMDASSFVKSENPNLVSASLEIESLEGDCSVPESTRLDGANQIQEPDPCPTKTERSSLDDSGFGSLEAFEALEVKMGDPQSPESGQPPTGSAIFEARPVPDFGLTDDHVQMLKRFSEDKWKFLMCVAALDVNKAATVDLLEAFFATFPNADEVEDRGWFDVSECLETIGLDGRNILRARTRFGRLATKLCSWCDPEPFVFIVFHGYSRYFPGSSLTTKESQLLNFMRGSNLLCLQVRVYL